MLTKNVPSFWRKRDIYWKKVLSSDVSQNEVGGKLVWVFDSIVHKIVQKIQSSMMNESYDYVPIIHLWMYYVCTYLLAQININSITISKLVSKRLQGVWSKNFQHLLWRSKLNCSFAKLKYIWKCKTPCTKTYGSS